jgi:hypothetical protein
LLIYLLIYLLACGRNTINKDILNLARGRNKDFLDTHLCPLYSSLSLSVSLSHHTYHNFLNLECGSKEK